MSEDTGLRGYPFLKVELLSDWYACSQSSGSLHFDNPTAFPNSEEILADLDGIVDVDKFNQFHVNDPIALDDPSGLIKWNLAAETDDDGSLFIPKGSICLVVRPQDSFDGHYELLNVGVPCPQGSGSERSGSEGSGSEGSEEGSGSIACDMTIPPCPPDASKAKPYVLTCDGGCLTWTVSCCEEPGCINCDPGTLPAGLLLAMNTDYNISGLCPDCPNWVSSFNLPRMTVDEVTNLWNTYPSTFTGYPLNPDDRGCWYRSTDALPCGCNFLAAEIFESNPDGVIIWWFGWADGNWVKITTTWSSTPGKNCLTNFHLPGDPDVMGYNSGGTLPCDFLLVISNLALAKSNWIASDY